MVLLMVIGSDCGSLRQEKSGPLFHNSTKLSEKSVMDWALLSCPLINCRYPTYGLRFHGEKTYLSITYPRFRSFPVVVEEFARREYGHPLASCRREVPCVSCDQTVGVACHG